MSQNSQNKDYAISHGQVYAYRIPTEEQPESDGTLKWDHTDLVVVTLEAAGEKGIGYTYSFAGIATLIRDSLLPLLSGKNALDNSVLWQQMVYKTRNLGRPGLVSMAIAAIDNALWDLKAKLLKIPLCKLLGQVHDKMPVYASGGFTSYDPAELADKFGKEASEGFTRFKMKIGRHRAEDQKRIEAARKVIGDYELMVDANGAYIPRQAVDMAGMLNDFKVSWYEEPVTSDDLDGLRFVREKVSGDLNITAGEYGFDVTYFNRMLSAGAVDILQADATRCAGISGFLKAHSLCEAHHLPMSSHCAPTVHLHAALACTKMIHMEYFRDHVRIEQMLFDGAPKAKQSALVPDLSRPGTGIDFKFKDAQKFSVNY